MFEVGKEYPLRGGGVVQVVKVIKGSGDPYPVKGVYKSELDGNWHRSEWAEDGMFYTDGDTHRLDIIAPAASTPSDLDTLKASHAELLAALKRLGSSEALGPIPFTINDNTHVGRELLARIDFARAAITNAEKL